MKEPAPSQNEIMSQKKACLRGAVNEESRSEQLMLWCPLGSLQCLHESPLHSFREGETLPGSSQEDIEYIAAGTGRTYPSVLGMRSGDLLILK